MPNRVTEVGQGDRRLDDHAAHVADVDDGRVRSGNGDVIDDDGRRVREGGRPRAQRVGEAVGADVVVTPSLLQFEVGNNLLAVGITRTHSKSEWLRSGRAAHGQRAIITAGAIGNGEVMPLTGRSVA